MDVTGANVDPGSQLRNVKDFLMIYNSLTEHCFMKCVTNLNYRSMTSIEQTCIMNCADVFTKGNQRFMRIFMEHTPEMVRKRNEEAEKQAKRAEMLLEASSQPPKVAEPMRSIDIDDNQLIL
uniref:Mitochondrial import inner membrane translocase subunit n=1 Tax=Phallusia mammillata TaxID=59560 RepID=A0A6F9DUZ8_9ASCI|nr:ZF(Tim10/DDP)-1 zinc finger protein 1 [Phallusia mammillata]